MGMAENRNEGKFAMIAKGKRPAVLDLDSLMVNPEKKPAPVQYAQEQAPAKKPASETHFRTSVYFSRAVHDKLREIAFEERKTVSDLIHEGLDAVLTSRNYPTTAELKSKA